ncbi:mitochondrial pyruvate carrier 3 isoform X5 [Gossypium hirsutum]|uniref:Mitochondrial pyruvate carrier n=1 Tax=Gossypium hirsutum TaxID=3635 RepID=A0ABM3ALA0_GOSHI|nr:mitochondrial pyruvate carrier 3-like isoform X5 [Gossypium hirsutum]XP_040955623.1 mitochondrial pyruvate carrier 3-like isoform X5 [Gossypium hirsutum]
MFFAAIGFNVEVVQYNNIKFQVWDLVHFWAPTFKWALNIANVVDISTKPAETVSYPQQAVLACSGLIWAKYSTVITPKNWNLFGVSIVMFATASYQISRKFQVSLDGRCV